MKFFTNKNIINKLIIAIVTITLLNFCITPMQVKAASIGGTLAKPIRDLAVTIGDALISIAQYGVMGEWIDAVERDLDATASDGADFWVGDGKKIKYPIIQISPELIFANQIEILSIDFIGGVYGSDEKEYIIDAEDSALGQLRKIIAGWYVTLRILAAVGLLSILLYVGIRIIISSTSQDKAKYKQRLVDWLVAACILFFMHYIMAGMITIISTIDKALTGGSNGEIDFAIPLDSAYGSVTRGTTTYEELAELEQELEPLLPQIQEYLNTVAKEHRSFILADYGNVIRYETEEKTEWQAEGQGAPQITTFYDDEGRGVLRIQVYTDVGSQVSRYNVSSGASGNGGRGREYIGSGDVWNIQQFIYKGTWPNGVNIESNPTEKQEESSETNSKSVQHTNNVEVQVSSNPSEILYYINYARLYCNANADNNAAGFGFTMVYLILVILTIMFLFRYIKRVIYVAFLTIIAPLVAMTYPLDKLKDGKAQAFNMWFKEYMFNALIQPFHLIIYMVLVGSATELAHHYPIYAVVAMAFMVPAEKLMRKFFGFDQAGTLSAAGSFAGGALFSTMLQRINRPKSGKGGKDGEGKDRKGIHMNRAPNSTGRVDADAVLTGTGTGDRQPTTIPTDAQTARTRGTRGRNTGVDSERVNRAAEARHRRAERYNRSEETTEELGTGAGTGAGTGTRSNSSAANTFSTPPATGTFGPDTFGPVDRFKLNNNVSAWDKNRRITTWDRLRGTNVNAREATRGMSKRSAEEYRQKLAEQARANRMTNAANIASAVGGHIKEQAIKGVKELPKNAARFTRRAAVGGLAGGALALTGAAVGAASGDPGAAMKMAAAGAAAGYYGANYYGDRAAEKSQEVNEIIDEAFWNEQNKIHQQQVSDEEFKNSEENIRMLAQFQGSMEAARESMSNGDVQEFRNEGFSDIKKIGRGLKLMEEYMKAPDGDARHRGLSKEEARQRAIAVAKWEDSAGAGLYETNSRAQQIFMARTRKQIMDGGVKDQQRADNEVKEIIRDMSYYRFGV